MFPQTGWSSRVGDWSRVEGTPDDPNPNKPFAKMENNPLFNSSGKDDGGENTPAYTDTEGIAA